ncbi:conserved hypothetical protein [Neospora caninum Liverpool]|uniref:Uncharacterized protein n=1 Tax=Neospora caninum (strain Liverpool) TaxID=572307 RepID=F0VPR5_NEOCL|nr:conserved hypothetical protein [Neospora caninum Liverpool]CBZ55712.1 conserved hypothetical protein [Neospora caninum Liverpool]CEL70455.1 TPA: hypothetical protein BN1204_061370 [Neospora caninum Liverpool]|eukprot:XP_003885738.1 conserved hypothetical protein [Neospora caninum Liverpool]
MEETQKTLIDFAPTSISLFPDTPTALSHLPGNTRAQQHASPLQLSSAYQVHTRTAAREAEPPRRQPMPTIGSSRGPSNLRGKRSPRPGARRHTPQFPLPNRRFLESVNNGYSGQRRRGVGSHCLPCRRPYPVLKQQPACTPPTKSFSWHRSTVLHSDTISLVSPCFYVDTRYYCVSLLPRQSHYGNVSNITPAPRRRTFVLHVITGTNESPSRRPF